MRYNTFSWEQRKLGDTFDFLQNNTLSRADLSAENGVAKNVHYGDVLIKFGEYLNASEWALPSAAVAALRNGIEFRKAKNLPRVSKKKS